MNREYYTLQRNLKDYRAMGYDVKVKLNARAELLLAEVVRIEKLVEAANTEVIDTEVEVAEDYRMEGFQPLDYPVVTATAEELEALEVAYQAPESDWIEPKSETVVYNDGKNRKDWVDLDNVDECWSNIVFTKYSTRKEEIVERGAIFIKPTGKFITIVPKNVIHQVSAKKHLTSRSLCWEDIREDDSHVMSVVTPACSLASKPKAEPVVDLDNADIMVFNCVHHVGRNTVHDEYMVKKGNIVLFPTQATLEVWLDANTVGYITPACSLAEQRNLYRLATRGVEVERYTEAMAAEDDELTAGVVVDGCANGSWAEVLEAKQKLESEIKRLSMVFDVLTKDAVATLYGLEPETFYYTAYEEWQEISRHYRAILDLMSKYRKEYETWRGVDVYRTAYGEWYVDFHDFLLAQGLNLTCELPEAEDNLSIYDGVDILAVNYRYNDTENSIHELNWVTNSCKVGIHTSNRYGEAYNAPACSLVYCDATNRAFGHDPEAVAEVRVVGGYQYYEGFIRRTATVTATMLTCDVCNYQQCELPVEQDLRTYKAVWYNDEDVHCECAVTWCCTYEEALIKLAKLNSQGWKGKYYLACYLEGSELPYGHQYGATWEKANNAVAFSHPLEYCATVSEWVEGVEGVPTGDHYPGQAVYPDWDETYTYESYLNSYCELTCDLPQPYIHPELGLVNGSSLTTKVDLSNLTDDDDYRYENADSLVANITYYAGDDAGKPTFHYYNKNNPLDLLRGGLHHDRHTFGFSEVHGAACSVYPEVTPEGVLKIVPEGQPKGCGVSDHPCPCGRMTANDCAGECGVMKPVDTITMSETEFDMTLAAHGFEVKPTVYSDHSQAISGSYPVIRSHDTYNKTAEVEVSKGVFETWVLKLTPPEDRDCIFDDSGSELYATRPRAWVELPENGKPRCARCDRLIGACQCNYEVTPAVKEAFKDTTAHYKVIHREPLLVAAINNTYGFLTSKVVTKTLRSVWFWSYASLCVLWAMVQLTWQGLTLAATVSYKAYKLATSPQAIALYDLVITQTLTILCNLTDYAETRWRLLWGFLDAGIELAIGLLPKHQPGLVKAQYLLD